MRNLLLASLLALTASAVSGQEKPDTTPAQEAAIAWLALTDSSNYGESWNQAAELFKKSISRENWEKALTSVRTPLGEVKSRSVKSSKFTTSLPSAPPGQYVVVQFTTSFAAGPERIETVTPMRDPDGKWRVSGYFIR
jgi:hypothetical protein